MMELPDRVVESLNESVGFSVTVPRVVDYNCSIDAYFELMREDDAVGVDGAIVAYRALMHGTAFETIPGVFRTNGIGISGRLTPPPNLLQQYFVAGLELQEERGPFLTADFIAKLAPFHTGNGLFARALYVALSERAGVDYVPVTGEAIDEVLGQQIEWARFNYPGSNGKTVSQYTDGDAAGWPWQKYLDQELQLRPAPTTGVM